MIIVALVLSFLVLFFLLALIKIFHKLWLIPNRIQYSLASQGIKGPSYIFLYGNSKEMGKMQKDAMTRPMSLSHNIYPKVQTNIESWSNIYGKNFLQWLGTKPQLVTMDSDSIKQVLNNKDRAYSKTTLNPYLKKLFGDGIVTTDGEKWVKLRKLANSAFHAKNLKGMIPPMISSAEEMLKRWESFEGKEIEVFEEFRLYTSDVISKTAFGSSYLEGKEIFQKLRRLTLIAMRNFFTIRVPIISKFLRSNDEIESERLEKEIRDCIIDMVRKREEKVVNGEAESYGSDLLGGLIKAHHDDDDETQKISLEDLINECKTFYFAGHETTNSLLAWTVFLLAVHTEWQEEARREVIKLFGQQSLNPDGIARLKIISMIINESMRLYPPATTLSRKMGKNGKLGNLNLPMDMEIVMSTIALHHDPIIWGHNSHEFKPERFSEGISRATNNNMASFFPFGIGPRMCVGMNFALIEAKIALSMILLRYSFTLSSAYVHSPFQFITLQAQQGVQIMIQPLRIG